MRRQLIFLALLAALLLPFAWQVAAPFLKALILAIIVAVLLEPLYARLAHKLARPRLASLLVTVATGLLILGAAWTVGSALVHQVSSAYESIAQPSEDGSWATTYLPAVADRIADALASRLPVDPAVVREQIVKNANGAVTWVLQAIKSVLGHTTSALVTLLLVLLFLYELLRHGRALIERALPALPLDLETGQRLVRNIHSTIVGVVGGTLVAALGEAVLTGAAFAIAGIRSAALLGLCCGLASIVPLVGCAIVWVPVALFEIVNGNYAKGIILAIWCGLATVVIDDIVRPAVARGHVQLHTLAIALSIIGGTRAFGIVGVVLGPLVISLLLAILQEFRATVALDRAIRSQHPSPL